VTWAGIPAGTEPGEGEVVGDVVGVAPPDGVGVDGVCVGGGVCVEGGLGVGEPVWSGHVAVAEGVGVTESVGAAVEVGVAAGDVDGHAVASAARPPGMIVIRGTITRIAPELRAATSPATVPLLSAGDCDVALLRLSTRLPGHSRVLAIGCSPLAGEDEGLSAVDSGDRVPVTVFTGGCEAGGPSAFADSAGPTCSSGPGCGGPGAAAGTIACSALTGSGVQANAIEPPMTPNRRPMRKPPKFEVMSETIENRAARMPRT